MITAIVTFKLKIEKTQHVKMKGLCPLKGNTDFTDLEGAHHSMIVEGDTRQEIHNLAARMVDSYNYEHITRIETL